MVLAGGPKQTSKELLDEADLWCASRGARQAGTARAAMGLGLLNAPCVPSMVNYKELWVPTEGQLSLLEEVCETMRYKKDENDELLGDWKVGGGYRNWDFSWETLKKTLGLLAFP